MSDGPFKMKYTNGKKADASAFKFGNTGVMSAMSGVRGNMKNIGVNAPPNENIQDKINRKVDEKVDEQVDEVVNQKTNEGLA